MPKIIRSADCGHSSKNQLLEDFAIARVLNDTDALNRQMSDEIIFTVVGQSSITGRSSVLTAVRDTKVRSISSLTILHVTQHGKVGAVSGQIKIRGGGTIDFCDMCEFTSAKGTAIAAITSYVVRSDP